MKSFRLYAVALAAALFLSISAEAKPNKAVVRAVRGGAAEIAQDGKTFKNARVGMQLGENAVVKTDANATVDLFLGENGPVVRVTKDTTLGIDRLDVESTGIEKVIETQLDLRNGTILGNVKKMAAASKYEVKTPVGVAGIRGTEYMISADGKVTVYTGTVVIVYIVDNVPQAPITINGGTEVQPPLTNGGQPRATSVTIDSNPEIPTLIIGISTLPDGRMLADGEIRVVTNDDGTTSVEVVDGDLDVTVIAPSDDLTNNPDLTNGPLTRIVPRE